MAIRKDANTLNSTERAELVGAVLELKRIGVYDQFVLRHANAVSRAIHRSPAFLPWHRRFIWDLERELQRVSGNSDLGLPYWNWPSGGSNASMWDNDLLGGNGDSVSGVVTNGPFREGQWLIVNSSGSQVGPLTRAFGTQSWARTLPTQQEIDEVLSITPYDSSPWNESSTPSFRNQLEGFRGPNLHNRGHGWVGGSMLPMTSPNDPVFFMHHCMVDKLWHEWQLRFPNQGYLPLSGGPFGQNLANPMDSTPSSPIGSRPIDVLDSDALGIEYDDLISEPPDSGQPDTILQVDGNSIGAEIGIPGEVDIFRFDVDAFGTYTVQTTGSSDTFMTLFGPNNSTNQVATDDDGGENLNARISRTLSAGSYFVMVRLYSASQTGSYTIQVNSEADALIPELVVDGPAVDADIASQNESDLFRFGITTPGDYIIETTGNTDTFLNLFGPNSQTAELASNDDSGFSRNAQIQRQLTPGEYFVRVRHYSRFSTGAYSIAVRS